MHIIQKSRTERRSLPHITPCLRDMNKIDLTIIRFSVVIILSMAKRKQILRIYYQKSKHTRINTHTHTHTPETYKHTHADYENHLIIQFKNYYKNDFSVSVNHQQQHCFSLLFFFARLNEQINEKTENEIEIKSNRNEKCNNP